MSVNHRISTLAFAIIPLASLMVTAVADTPSATPPDTGAIVVRQSADPAPAGTGWEITLPAGAAKTLQDQMWLVVDGKSEGLGGGDFLGDDTTKPLHVYAAADDVQDTEVKEILKAQGIPIKSNISVFRVTYGLNSGGSRRSLPLRFRHAVWFSSPSPLPDVGHYKPGDRITLFDALMLDSSIKITDVRRGYDPLDPQYKRLANDLVHRVTIQVQFIPAQLKPLAP